MAKLPKNTLHPLETKTLHEPLLRIGSIQTEAYLSDIFVKLEVIMRQLDDIESSHPDPVISLPLDLGLDQIEANQE